METFIQSILWLAVFTGLGVWFSWGYDAIGWAWHNGRQQLRYRRAIRRIAKQVYNRQLDVDRSLAAAERFARTAAARRR